MSAKVYQDMSIDNYHGDKDSISRSGIVEFMSSPRRYFMNRMEPDPNPKEASRALIFGSAFHTIILEPHLFSDTYIIKPEPILLKDTDRKTYDDHKAHLEEIKNSGLIVLSKDEFETLWSMKESVEQHPEAKGLLEGASYENSIFWDDQQTGLRLKTRPDAWHENMTVDLKTIASADPRSFQNAMAQRGYHIQSAMNREGIMAATRKDVINHVFVCVEKTFPFLVAVYILDETALEHAHNTLRRVLSEMKYCYETNEWPGYQTQTLGLPNWAANL